MRLLSTSLVILSSVLLLVGGGLIGVLHDAVVVSSTFTDAVSMGFSNEFVFLLQLLGFVMGAISFVAWLREAFRRNP